MAKTVSFFKKIGREILRDWEFDHKSKSPPEPTKFTSMYTNIYGERWWCREMEDGKDALQLLVWGDDVSIAMTRRGSRAKIYPWVMEEGERLWLRASLSRLAENEGFRERKKAQS